MMDMLLFSIIDAQDMNPNFIVTHRVFMMKTDYMKWCIAIKQANLSKRYISLWKWAV